MAKKIALLGNMNNNLFNMCRYLRNKGFDAILYVFPYDSAHFRPEADCFDDSYKSYVRNLNWGNPYELGAVSRDEINNELKDYDFIIGCGTAPAFLAKAKMRLDLFAPYGSDLYHYPFFNLLNAKKLRNFLVSFLFNRKQVQQSTARSSNWKGYVPFVLKQRKGIRQSYNCAVLSSGVDVYAQSLRRLKFQNNYFRFSIPMVYTGQYNQEELKKYYAISKRASDFRKIRESSDFLIFTNCRHCWKNEKDPVSFKGNDRLLKGFSEFIKSYKGRASIITFEYGTDFPESQRLCDELGISENVHWFPLLDRKEIMIGMNMADLVVGNLSDASWATYGIVYESMALSKPILHHRDDSLYPKDTLYPMINAFSTDTVTKNLSYYSRNRDELKTIGEGAYLWFKESCVDEPINQIQKMINSKS